MIAVCCNIYETNFIEFLRLINVNGIFQYENLALMDICDANVDSSGQFFTTAQHCRKCNVTTEYPTAAMLSVHFEIE